MPDADRSFDILVNGIDRIMHAGAFRRDDPLLLAEAVWASMHGVIALMLDQRDHLSSNPDALVTTVIDMAIQGLSC